MGTSRVASILAGDICRGCGRLGRGSVRTLAGAGCLPSLSPCPTGGLLVLNAQRGGCISCPFRGTSTMLLLRLLLLPPTSLLMPFQSRFVGRKLTALGGRLGCERALGNLAGGFTGYGDVFARCHLVRVLELCCVCQGLGRITLVPALGALVGMVVMLKLGVYLILEKFCVLDEVFVFNPSKTDCGASKIALMPLNK